MNEEPGLENSFSFATLPSLAGAPSRAGQPPPLTGPLCYRFCLSSPFVHVTLTGPKNRAQLDENLAALEQGPLNEETEAWIREYGKRVRAAKRFTYF